MSSYNQPRRGSMAFYPRGRAAKQTPSMKASGKEAKALSFLAYKVGMTQILGKNNHKGSPSYGQDIALSATVVAVPSLKVFGVRAYGKADIGIQPISDVLAENLDNSSLARKIHNFKKPSQKKVQKGSENKEKSKKEIKKAYTLEDFEKEMEGIENFTLLVHTQPKGTGVKKTPDISEIYIGGKKEEQFAYAKEKLGKELEAEEVLNEGEFLDVKGVTKGKGFEGVIKRFNVRMHRPKAKKRRVVGCISPWTPATVMFTVGRPGQMGYQNRTEHNKKLLKISEKLDDVNPREGFKNYGMVKEKYAIIQGSLPGPAKRCLAMRKSQRPPKKSGVFVEAVEKVLINKPEANKK